MALDSEDIQKIVEALTGLKDSVDSTTSVFERTDNLIKKFNKELKETQPVSKAFKDMLSGNKQQLESLAGASKTFNDAIKKARDSADVLTEANLAQEKTETIKRIAVSNAGKAAVNFGIGLGGVAKTMLSGAVEFVKGLQGTQEGTELTGQAALKAAEATGKVAETMGSLAQAIGLVMAIIPAGRIVKFVGLGLSALGVGLEQLGPALTETATEGVKILNTELEKTKNAFRIITSTGAEFAGGMTELRKISAEAGIDIGQLATIVKSGNENLSNMGLGIADSIKRFGSINKELRNSQLGIQLRKLGLSAEEQADMVLQTSAMLNASGKLRNMNEKEVAATTVEYTKYLKILSNLTGEDAKKKLEEARTKALEVDVLAKLMAEGGEEAVSKFQAQYAQLPEQAKKAYLEYVSSGGTAIVDAASNVFMAAVPAMETQFVKMFADLGDSSVGFKEAGTRALEMSKATAMATMAARDSLAPIGQAGRMINDALAQGSTDIANGFILFNTKFAEGSVKATDAAVEAASKNKAALDSQVAVIDEFTQKLKADLGTALTGPLTTYTGVLATGTTALENFETAIKNATEAAGGKPATSYVDSATKTTSSMVTPKPGESKQSIEKRSNDLKSSQDLLNKIGKKDGGISTGPLSGYHEVLHGTEAVVPLPDNRSIPVTLTNSQSNNNTIDTKEMVSAINQQSGLLNQILTAMEKNNQLTSGILQTSY
jgi:hypothetical protein